MKPTYEQLEQQLAAVISERDAAVNAERIWEKTMMQACGEDGPASVADEIAALRAQRDTALESLRQQLAAVVAENAHMQQVIGDVQTLYYESDGIVGYHLSGEIAKWDDVMPDLWAETPATDAYLAEVRAEIIEWLDAEISAIDPVYRGDPSYEHDAYWMKTEVQDLIESARKVFAAQLRQGAEQ